MAEVTEKIDAACVRSGARAQEMINGEGPTKAAKRRASKKRAEARRAEEKAARREAQKQIARKESQAESDIPDEASAEVECVSEHPRDAFIAAEGEAVIEEGAVAEGKAAINEAFIVEVLTEAEVSEQNELSGQGVPSCQNIPSEQGISTEQRIPSDEVAPEKQAFPSKQAPLSRQAFPSKGADSSKQSDQKPVKRCEHLTVSKRDTAEPDWTAAREVLARETRAYLKAARKLSRKDDASSKQFASAAKPVYKALKPFLTCSDEVCAFDACLVCIRLIAQDAQTRAQHGQPELPQTTHSLLGNFQKLMKASVRKLIRADEIVAACTEELLREEAAKPVYKSLPNSPLKQCLDIISSKKPKEAAEPDEAPRAKPVENTITEGKTSEGKRRRRRRRKKEHAENKGSEKQNRSAESEEETKAEAAQ